MENLKLKGVDPNGTIWHRLILHLYVLMWACRYHFLVQAKTTHLGGTPRIAYNTLGFLSFKFLLHCCVVRVDTNSLRINIQIMFFAKKSTHF